MRIDAEQARGAAAAFDFSARGGERSLNVRFHRGRKRDDGWSFVGCIWRGVGNDLIESRAGGPQGVPVNDVRASERLCDVKSLAIAENRSPVDDRAQLANVAGPGIAHESLQ